MGRVGAMPESAQDYYDRILAAADADGRLPLAVEAMPGWDIFPFELDGLRMILLRGASRADQGRRFDREAALAKAYAAEKGMKIGEIMKPVRALITGSTASPSVFEIISIIGKEEAVKRLKN